MRRMAIIAGAAALVAGVQGAEAHRRSHCQTRDCLKRTCVSDQCHGRVAAKERARRAPRSAPVLASWYGPGLYGNPLGCPGMGTLQPGTAGVANKELPCGTTVKLCQAARRGCAGPIVTTHVIDRGPYVGGRTFDLTAAVRARLGTAPVDAVRFSVVGPR